MQSTTDIVLRKDVLRIRKRVRDRIRRATRRAEVEGDRRLDKVARSLRGKVDFYLWDWDKSPHEEWELMLEAILREWGTKADGGMTEGEILRKFHLLIITGTLQILVVRGDLITERDSYGRTQYSTKYS